MREHPLIRVMHVIDRADVLGNDVRQAAAKFRPFDARVGIDQAVDAAGAARQQHRVNHTNLILDLGYFE